MNYTTPDIEVIAVKEDIVVGVSGGMTGSED